MFVLTEVRSNVNAVSPEQRCWADKQPWGSSSAWAGPRAGVSPECKGACSGPSAGNDLTQPHGVDRPALRPQWSCRVGSPSP